MPLIKRQAPEKKKRKLPLKFCPRCGSTDVFWAQGLPQLWSLWQCRNCGYYGPAILENGKLATKLQEIWKEKNTQKKRL
jgi:DNA-directed RNA polymerase subunit M